MLLLLLGWRRLDLAVRRLRHLALDIDQAAASIHAWLRLDLHVRPLVHLVLAQSARLQVLLLFDVIAALSINEVDSAQR